MEDHLAFASTQTNLSIRTTVDGGLNLADRVNGAEDNDPGRVYALVRRLKNDRAYLSPSTPYDGSMSSTEKSKDAVESSAVRAIQSLFENPVRKGVVNVLFDEPGTGKSMAGISVLSDYYMLPEGNEIQGFMVSTQASSGLYVENLAEILKATEVEGWFHALLLGMDEPKEKLPSLLILDDFSLDEGGKNLQFIEHLYKSMNPPHASKKNIIVVVMTQNRDAADALCNLNGGRLVRPISGFYDTRERDFGHIVLTAIKMRDPQHFLTHPTWKRSQWTKDLLIQVLCYHFLESELEQIQSYDFVQDGDNPFDVLQEAESRLLASKAGRPASPRKQGQSSVFRKDSTPKLAGLPMAVLRRPSSGSSSGIEQPILPLRRNEEDSMMMMDYQPAREKGTLFASPNGISYTPHDDNEDVENPSSSSGRSTVHSTIPTESETDSMLSKSSNYTLIVPVIDRCPTPC